MDTFLGRAKCSFINSLIGSWPWPCPFISDHSIVWALWLVNVLFDQNLPTVSGAPRWEEEWIIWPLVLKIKKEMAKPSRPFLQPAKIAVMCMACDDAPIPTFLLVQKLSLKQLITCSQSSTTYTLLVFKVVHCKNKVVTLVADKLKKHW